MLAKRIIPCLDVDRGRVVKGIRFLDLIDAGDQEEQARRYDREGADELVFLDITASSDSREIVHEMVRRVADSVFIPFTVGGGIRTVEDIARDARVGRRQNLINTAAINDPSASARGPRVCSQAIVVAIDARRRLKPQFHMGGLQSRRENRDRARGGRVGAPSRKTRSGRNIADKHGPRRHARRIRHRLDRSNFGGGIHPGNRFRRRGNA